MFPIYSFAYCGAGLILSPYLYLKGLTSNKYLWNHQARLGKIPLELEPKENRTRAWVHTLSLGETLSAQALLTKLTALDFDVCLSTTTRSGHEISKEKFENLFSRIQFPYDWPPAVRRVQSQVKPDIFVLVETDIWPNFLAGLHQSNIPGVLLNARVSDRSFSRLKLVKRWWRKVLALFSFIGVQSLEDYDRMLALGAPDGILEITGNLKFDRTMPDTGPEVRTRLLKETGLPDGRWLVGGSTHQGEDEILLDVYKNLKTDFPDLKLILAPRDEARFEPVWNLINAAGFPSARFSGAPAGSDTDIFLLDTFGKLDDFFELADLVFIGKSLPVVKEPGGHNLLEPASRKKPVLFGPLMNNFKEIAELMIKNHGGFMVNDQRSLEQTARQLLASPDLARQTGANAYSMVKAHGGARDRSIKLIQKALEKKKVEEA